MTTIPYNPPALVKRTDVPYVDSPIPGKLYKLTNLSPLAYSFEEELMTSQNGHTDGGRGYFDISEEDFLGWMKHFKSDEYILQSLGQRGPNGALLAPAPGALRAYKLVWLEKDAIVMFLSDVIHPDTKEIEGYKCLHLGKIGFIRKNESFLISIDNSGCGT